MTLLYVYMEMIDMLRLSPLLSSGERFVNLTLSQETFLTLTTMFTRYLEQGLPSLSHSVCADSIAIKDTTLLLENDSHEVEARNLQSREELIETVKRYSRNSQLKILPRPQNNCI